MKKFISELGIVPKFEGPVSLYCSNTGAVKEPRAQFKSKHILRYFHLIWGIVERQEIFIKKVETKNNIVDPFTKALPQREFDRHLEIYGVKI